MSRLVLAFVLLFVSAQSFAENISQKTYERMRSEAVPRDFSISPLEPVTVAVRWTPTTIQIEMPDPYRVWFVQFSWIESSPELAIVDSPHLVFPLPGRWQDGAYNPDCNTYCEDPPDSTTTIGIANYIDFEGGGFQEAATTKIVNWSWSWEGNGTVTFGHTVRCGFFSNNPVHLWVHDRSREPTDPLYDQVWFCDSVETRLGVQPGVLSWDVQPLVINDTPVAVAHVTWTAIKQMMR